MRDVNAERRCSVGWRFLLLLLVASACSFAQDELRVSSPDGHLDFRLFVASQQDTALFRIAYQVYLKQDHSNEECLIDTSFMGLDIWDQEPLLGENDGLISSSAAQNSEYHSLIARYMQNGSLGRRLDVEVRVYNAGIAFRYIIPRTNAVEELLIADESTEFAVVKPDTVAIAEIPPANYPPMHLVHEEGSILLTRLRRRPDKPVIAFQGSTPFTGPWRVIGLGGDASKLVSLVAGK